MAVSVVSRRWPWFLTGVVLAAAVLAGIVCEGWPSAEAVGSFVAGFAGAVAFIWLVAGYFQQKDELALQREELRAQRESLDLQKVELHRMAVHGALGQMAIMLSDFDHRLPGLAIAGLSGYEDIGRELAERLDALERAIRLDRAELIIEGYASWVQVESIALRFLASIQMGAELYQRHAEGFGLDPEPDPVLFLLKNDGSLRTVPHISDRMHAGRELASALQRLRPWRLRASARFAEAREAVAPGRSAERGHARDLGSQIDAFVARCPP